MASIDCTDQYGNLNKFEYQLSIDTDKLIWMFKIYSNDDNAFGHFSFHLREINDEYMEVVLMDNNGNKCYSGKGIPDRIIEVSARLLKKKIVSSSRSSLEGISKTNMDKVWARLIRKGFATFDVKANIYKYVTRKRVSIMDTGERIL